MGVQIGIDVLGSLSLYADRAYATPTAPKERKVLALLLMNHSRVVPVSRLVEELWHDSPPKTALTALQTYILNIRRSISVNFSLPQTVVSRELLRTGNMGYVFHTESCFFDLAEFRRLEAAGRLALRAGDQDAAVRHLQRADDLWQGTALVDVECGLPLQAEVSRLEQSRQAARGLRIETLLRIGRHEEVLSELAALVLQHPFDEHLHAYYMIALQRSGCRPQALEVFHRLRRSMADDLGLEPSPDLQRLQREILGQGTAAGGGPRTVQDLLQRTRLGALPPAV
ncbi:MULTISPECIES: AfsR/SARP family transcriptional regulator [Streptomyces]|uniref:AfsR/SARP family transcriptional regulator n=1 Tax=Streptomyces TaxID=1883 RepID=UPI00163C1502|nr:MULTISPECIES: AfsR/SARP family transcriptional regulator [Streptomyces]MBC2876889.1 AfsR/SARP family transcriptional regulator [Streptomyces sp. TYQ1024]UBI35918.1 AfsR/SARP family transcriptional regulator [Streptomyces mobaraensis]UKW28512.1 AfsR/SARP family transcriptional regulator [Streptomyces sp. TYQ1024]